MTTYTEKHAAELAAGAPWDFTSATEFATKYGFTPRSVVAKIGALGLAYKAKDKAAPRAKSPKAPPKAELAASIEAALELRLPSLDKMNAADLTALLQKVGCL